jgi:hypothetical protein
MYEQHCSAVRRRALTAMALAGLFAVLSISVAVPAGAGVAVPQATHTVAEPSLRGHASAKKPKKAKKAKPARKTASGHGHLSKKDDVEILLLVLAPFIVTALFLYGSGSRRLRASSPAPATSAAQSPPRRRWRPRRPRPES